jgi:hypothetical protein
VVLAMGDRLIYRDNFDEALADLTGTPAPSAPPPAVSASAPAPATNPKTGPTLADQLRALREQSEQLTRELQKLEQEAGKK